MRKGLLAIGEALIDMIPERTGCAFNEAGSFTPALGGAPANVCCAFAKLGGQARLLTMLGADPFGDRIIDELSACGVQTDGIFRTKTANTALAFVTLGADGARTFTFYRNPSADLLLSPEQVEERWFTESGALHFCSVDLLPGTPMRRAHEKALTYADRHALLISFDPNLRLALWPDKARLRETVQTFLPRADLLKISDDELEFITGEKEIEAALPLLLRGRTKLVLYTCGGQGAYGFTAKARVFVPGETVPVLDTTGAGDAFSGAVLYHLLSAGIQRETLAALSEDTLFAALSFANHYCGISVGRHGGAPSYPKKEELI